MEARVCRVWWARLGDVGQQHDVLLSDADLHRRSRLAREDDRRRATAGAALARLALGAVLGVRPADLEIDRTCRRCGAQHGRPHLPAAPELGFSVSHSGERVVVAVVGGSLVGVDVEETARADTEELDALAACVLAGEEQAELARLPADERLRGFTTYWTRKEAVLKAVGAGLTLPVDELVVTSPSAPPRVLRWPAAAGQQPRLVLHELHAPAGYAAALALAGDVPAVVREHDAGPLLARAVAS